MENHTDMDGNGEPGRERETPGRGSGCLFILALAAAACALAWLLGDGRLERIKQQGAVMALVPLLFLAFLALFAIAIVFEGKKGGPALLRIPAALLVVLGATGAFLPASASLILPHSWEWPVQREVRTLALDNGAFAVEATGGRVQIYGHDETYRAGWFAPTYGKSFSMRHAAGTGLWVRANGEHILYDLEGNVRLRREASASRDFGDGPYAWRRMATAWWLLPLSCRPYGIATGVIGVMLYAVSCRLGRWLYPDRRGRKG